jgi:hypothetical protein
MSDAAFADLAKSEAHVEGELLAVVPHHVIEQLVDMDMVPVVAVVEGETKLADRHVGPGAIAAAAKKRRADTVEESPAAALPLRGVEVEGVPVGGL